MILISSSVTADTTFSIGTAPGVTEDEAIELLAIKRVAEAGYGSDSPGYEVCVRGAMQEIREALAKNTPPTKDKRTAVKAMLKACEGLEDLEDCMNAAYDVLVGEK